MAYIEIKDLTFSYNTSNEGVNSDAVRKNALFDVSIDIERGEYVVICGRSGCGKTTLLKTLKPALLEAGKMSGSISIGGTMVQDMTLKCQTETAGFVCQDPNEQIVTDKVWHEVAFTLENLGTDPVLMRLRVAETANCFGMTDWLDMDVASLSGGQRQLMNLASVMAVGPQILILDEPTSQLDPIAASEFLSTVKRINREFGTTVIITEHRLEEILPSSDKVIILEDGMVAACGTPRKVARELYTKGDDMLEAFPTPARVYYGLADRLSLPGKESGSIANDGSGDTNAAGSGRCPLNVREGRAWLSDVMKCHAENTEKPAKCFKCTDVTPDRVREDRKTEAEKKIALEISDLWFRYEKNGRDILKGTDISIERGSVYALAGGNGAGKSTLLKSICGIIKPYRGSIRLFGKRLEKIGRDRLFYRNIAMLPQDVKCLFSKESIREDLAEMINDKSNMEVAISHIANICGIEDILRRHPYDLSGGELQRAALAKVLLTEPALLLLDEPTKGMDSFFKKSFGNILHDLKDTGTTILMVSHDIEFCAIYADRAGMFFDGIVIGEGKPEEFFGQNNFYTTAASRMARDILPNVLTADDIIKEII